MLTTGWFKQHACCWLVKALLENDIEKEYITCNQSKQKPHFWRGRLVNGTETNLKMSFRKFNPHRQQQQKPVDNISTFWTKLKRVYSGHGSIEISLGGSLTKLRHLYSGHGSIEISFGQASPLNACIEMYKTPIEHLNCTRGSIMEVLLGFHKSLSCFFFPILV